MYSNILVKALNWIGDAVMASPFFESLKKGNNSTKITVISRPWTATIYRRIPFVDEVIECDDKKNKLEFIKILRKRKDNFDLAITLPKSFGSAILLKLAGQKNISGFATQYRNFLLDKPVKLTEDLKKKHQVYLHLALAYSNGGAILEKPKLSLTLDTTIEQAVKKKWLGGLTNPKYLLINPGAAFGPAKRWKPEYFADVITQVCSKTNASVIIIGSAKEFEIAENIRFFIKDKQLQILNLAGATTLDELIVLINNSHCFLTNDSGPMHIAAALNVKQVALFASTNPITTGPFSDKAQVISSGIACAPCIKRTCKFGTYECFNLIKTEKVVEKILEIW